MTVHVSDGLEDVVAAETVLSEVDGQAGRLIIRGRSLDELAGRTSYEDVAHLLWDGFFDDLPADVGPALGAARAEVFAEVSALDSGLLDRSPIEAMRALTARLADGDDLQTALRLTAAPAVFTAAVVRGQAGEAPVRPDPALGPVLRKPADRVYDDSVRPVIEAGLAKRIAVNGEEVLEGISFIPTPGHSIDHASIRLTSRGEQALFAGDVMHHPLQVYEPTLNSCFCEFPEAALRSRDFVLEDAAERGATVFTTHFAQSSVGRISRTGDRFSWQFI